MVLTQTTEDDDLAQLLLEAESEELTSAPSALETTPSFGDALINGTSSPSASPTRPTNPTPPTVCTTPSNGFSDRLNRSASAAGDEASTTKW